MSMNHDRLNDYICKLKILSKLEPREKIIIHERTIEIVDYTTYNLARLKKMVNLEHKWHMIGKLEAMYRDIDSIVDNLVNNPPNRTPEQDILFALDRLRHDLDGSLQGLHNLILTYNSNKSATSKLETLYEDVKILSQKINKFFNEKRGFPPTSTPTSTSTGVSNSYSNFSGTSSNSSSGIPGFAIVDRRNYGVENVYEESKKVKQINEFDPSKAELQVPVSAKSLKIKSSLPPPLPPVKVPMPTQVPQKLVETLETLETIVENDDDTFSESPISEPDLELGLSAVGVAVGVALGAEVENGELELEKDSEVKPNMVNTATKNGKKNNRRNRRR